MWDNVGKCGGWAFFDEYFEYFGENLINIMTKRNNTSF